MTRILLVGNSVALYTRPRQTGARPYGRIVGPLLRERTGDTVEVELWAENSLTVSDAVEALEDRIVSWSPDILVLNFGIVDCTPRIVPQRLRRRFVRARTPLHRLWLAAEALVRRPIVRLLGGASAMSARAFESALARLIDVARSEAGARVFCLGMSTTSVRVEWEVPGVQRQIAAFDKAIRRACQRWNAFYVDVGAMLASGDADRLRPDGIHFSAEGHAMVAEELARQITAGFSRMPSGTPAVDTPARPPTVVSRLAAGVVAAVLTPVALVWIILCRAWRGVRGESL
jgi:lysophospholipase L1-like esterase